MRGSRDNEAGVGGYSIRSCATSDAAQLAALGSHLFVQAYGPTHPEPELSAYLARSFDAEKVARDLGSGDVCAHVVEDESHAMIGYAYLRVSTNVTSTVNALRPLEIQRFYVDTGWHGLGVAQALMVECVAEAVRRRSDALWLSVWQKAPRPQAFYKRMGFQIVGTAEFYFGDTIEDDFVMVRPIEPGESESDVSSYAMSNG